MKISARSWLASATAWLVGAAAAVVIGMQAVALLGAGLGAEGVQPLSGAAGAPAGLRPSPDEPSSGDSPSPSGSGPSSAPPSSGPPVRYPSAPPSSAAPAVSERVVTSPGGVVVVRCRDSRAYLVSWSPERGYRADDVRRGPAEVVTVKFVAARHEVEISVRCVGGIPTPRVDSEDQEADG